MVECHVGTRSFRVPGCGSRRNSNSSILGRERLLSVMEEGCETDRKGRSRVVRVLLYAACLFHAGLKADNYEAIRKKGKKRKIYQERCLCTPNPRAGHDAHCRCLRWTPLDI